METKKQSRKELFEKMQSARVTLSVALSESLKDYVMKNRKAKSEREEDSEFLSEILLIIEESPFSENIAKDLYFDMLRLFERKLYEVVETTSFEHITPAEYSEMTPAQFAAAVKTAQAQLLRPRLNDIELIKIYKSYYDIFNTPNENSIF